MCLPYPSSRVSHRVLLTFLGFADQVSLHDIHCGTHKIEQHAESLNDPSSCQVRRRSEDGGVVHALRQVAFVPLSHVSGLGLAEFSVGDFSLKQHSHPNWVFVDLSFP